ATVIGKDLALIPAVTGPVTLASHLRGPVFLADLNEAPERACRALEAASQVTVLVARRYLDMGFEQLVVSDPLLGRVDPAHYPAIASALRSLWNVAEFYDARVLLQTQVDDAARLEHLAGVGAHGLLVELLEDDTPPGVVVGEAGAAGRPFGVGVPARLLQTKPPDLERALAAWQAEACAAGSLALCLTIPRSTPPENLHAVVQLLRG
ncbi:MAG TPA: uroporphyrinogen decarboxylase family protein, partial [Thermoleophilia bacterium]|nr:uroporphyrinogen decarboxylase family protein [Thermoleophilia bacterium]